jgi:hypothetical protein
MTRLSILIVIGLPLIAAACQDVGPILLIGAAFSTLLLFRRSAR